MPQPTVNDLHISRPLTNISVAYLPDLTQFVSTRVFPIIPVEYQFDSYYTYDKADWFRDEAQPRVDEDESAGSGYNVSTATYRAVPYAFHKDIGRMQRANADPQFNLERDATLFVTQRLALRQERDWMSTFFAASIWATTVDGVSAAPGAGEFLQWNDADSDPIADIEAGKRTILATTGFMPNTLVLGYDVMLALKYHPDITDRFKYTSPDNITSGMIAAFFELQRVLVTSAIWNSAIEGATPSYAFVAGKHALLAYVAPSPGLLVPSAGYTFNWTGISAGLGTNVAVKRIDMRPTGREITRIEAEAAWDHKAIATDLGYFFATAVA